MRSILLLVISLAFLNAYGQDLQNFEEIELEKIKNGTIDLTQEWSLHVTTKSDSSNDLIEFKKSGEVMSKDAIEFATEGYNCRLLKLSRNDEYLVILESIHEYISYYPIYIIKPHGVSHIGNLDIRLDCNDCDVLNYPIKDITVKGDYDRILITFEQDLKLKEGRQLVNLKKDELYFMYEYVTGELATIKSVRPSF